MAVHLSTYVLFCVGQLINFFSPLVILLTTVSPKLKTSKKWEEVVFFFFSVFCNFSSSHIPLLTWRPLLVYLHLNMYDMYASYITVVYNISSAIVFSMGRTCCKIITESEPELILHDNLVISYQGPHFHFFL